MPLVREERLREATEAREEEGRKEIVARRNRKEHEEGIAEGYRHPPREPDGVARERDRRRTSETKDLEMRWKKEREMYVRMYMY